jgi:hypothetical protein
LRFKDILINFDDNLIKKVERQKYKHLKSFMLKEDGDKLLDPETSSTASSSNESGQSATGVITSVSNNSSTILLTRKTNLPDVYELLDKSMSVQGYACIPSLKTSNYMRTLFKNKNIVDTLAIEYVRSNNPNFAKRWLPMTPETA